MSDFKKDLNTDAEDNDEAVEAFDNFDMSSDETEASEANYTSDETQENVENKAVEEAEEAETVEEAEEAETVEEAEEAETVEEAEEAETVEETEEAETVEEAEEAETVEEAEEAETVEEAEEAETVEEAEEAETVEEADEAETVEEAEEAETVKEAEEAETVEEADEDETVEEADEDETVEEADEDETVEEVDEDDYLDYDDSPRPKTIVSGKAALITMLVTCFVTIGLIVGAVWMGLTVKRDIGVTVASFSDRFNACNTNQFALGAMLGADPVSMSDEECSLSEEDIAALKRGNTISKFNNMLNIKADIRLGKIVSMDITYDPSVNDQVKPSVTCILLLGNVMSGLSDGIKSSDNAFITAYTALVEKCVPAPKKGSEVYVYNSEDGIALYACYSKMAETGSYSDVTYRIESQNPDYINTENLDFSWLPFDFSSDKAKSSENTASPSDK